MTESKKSSPIFYGWIVLFISFLGLFATLGIRNSFSAYVTSWEETFVISRTLVASISAVSLVVYGLFQPIAGRLVDRIGARLVLSVSLGLVGIALILSSFANHMWQMFVLYGLVASIGFAGASNVTATAVAATWFEKQRGRAMGLVLSGMAAGPLVIAPLTLYLVDTWDWRSAMLLFGLVTGVVLAPIAYFIVRARPEEIGLVPYGQETAATTHSNADSKINTSPLLPSTSVWAVLKERYFWMLALPNFICGFTDLGLIFTHFTPFAEGRGFSIGIIGLVFGVMAAFNLLGTISSGFLADRMHRGKQLAITYGLRSLTFMMLLYADSPWMLILFAILFGLTEVAAIAPTGALCAHLFGSGSVGLTLGFVSLCHQLGGALGAFLPGLFYDLFGTYNHFFIIAFLLLILSAVSTYLVPDSEHEQRSQVSLSS